MIAIPIILTALITFVITKKHSLRHYNTTIKYKNGIIDSYISENKALRQELHIIQINNN